MGDVFVSFENLQLLLQLLEALQSSCYATLDLLADLKGLEADRDAVESGKQFNRVSDSSQQCPAQHVELA